MTYNPNIPQPNDFLADSQGQILSNFTVSNSIMDINHYNFSNLTADKGKHKFMQMPEQTVLPATAVNEGALYTKVGTNPAETNLFFRAENSGGGGGFEYQLTKVVSASTALFATNANYQVGPPALSGGWTFLPGNLILQYGRNDVAASVNTYTFNFPFVFPNNVFNIQITPFRAATNPGNDNEFWVVTGFTTTQFQIYNKGGHSFSFMWIAIGN